MSARRLCLNANHTQVLCGMDECARSVRRGWVHAGCAWMQTIHRCCVAWMSVRVLCGVDESAPAVPECKPYTAAVAWLLTQRQQTRFTVEDVQVLTSTMGVVSSARDLGVVTESVDDDRPWVSLSPSVLSFATDSTDTTITVSGCWKGAGPGVHFHSPGLLQLDSLWRHWQPYSTSAVSSECCRQAITQTGQCEHITSVLWELHWLPVQRCIEFKLAMLMYKTLHDTTPPCLSVDVSRWSSATLSRVVPRTSTRPVIVRLMSPVCRSGTSCQLPCIWKRTLDILSDCWKHTCSIEAAAPSDFCF